MFEEMLAVLKIKYAEEPIEGGQPGLLVELRLTLALEYWREYRIFEHMSNDHQIAKSVIKRAVLWVEDALLESPEFKLPELKEQFKPGESEIKIILADVTEQPIERPVENQKDSYSGKKNVTQRDTKS